MNPPSLLNIGIGVCVCVYKHSKRATLLLINSVFIIFRVLGERLKVNWFYSLHGDLENALKFDDDITRWHKSHT